MVVVSNHIMEETDEDEGDANDIEVEDFGVDAHKRKEKATAEMDYGEDGWKWRLQSLRMWIMKARVKARKVKVIMLAKLF
ncbi:hypothetical protein MKW92_024478 [Papaver armeniacum]|nr:hypothetical protein MKW92_024478 [Papaver armeniacum]